MEESRDTKHGLTTQAGICEGRTFETKRQRLHQDEAEHPFYYGDKGEKSPKHSEGKYKFPNMKTKILDGLGFLLHKLNSKRRRSSKHGCFEEIFGICGSRSSLRGPKAAERLTDAGAQSCIVRVPSRESRPKHGLSSKWKPKPRTACGRHGAQCGVSFLSPVWSPRLGIAPGHESSSALAAPRDLCHPPAASLPEPKTTHLLFTSIYRLST